VVERFGVDAERPEQQWARWLDRKKRSRVDMQNRVFREKVKNNPTRRAKWPTSGRKESWEQIICRRGITPRRDYAFIIIACHSMVYG
jgi:hypothetical protein